MSKNRVYSQESRVALYRAIVQHFGWYDRNKWHLASGNPQCPLAPSNWTTAQRKQAFEEIYTSLVEAGVFLSTPKSSEALAQQLAWCMTTQTPKDNLQRRLIHLNRDAAYEAGFLTRSDIVFLESLAKEHITVLPIDNTSDITDKGVDRGQLLQAIYDYFEDGGANEVLEENGVNTEAFLHGLYNIIDDYI